MNKDKSLTASVKTTLYQREKLVDKIQFLLPQKYEDLNINDCIILLKYVDRGNVAHAEKLNIDEELYKEHVRCVLPIDTNLTQFAGDIKIHLSFLNLNLENGIHEEVLHSGESTITISPISDIYQFVADESLEIIDRAMLEIEARLKAHELIADTYNKEKADNIIRSEDGDNITLQLTSNGIPIGNKVSAENLNDNGVPITILSSSTLDDNNTDEKGNTDVVEF